MIGIVDPRGSVAPTEESLDIFAVGYVQQIDNLLLELVFNYNFFVIPTGFMVVDAINILF